MFPVGQPLGGTAILAAQQHTLGRRALPAQLADHAGVALVIEDGLVLPEPARRRPAGSGRGGGSAGALCQLPRQLPSELGRQCQHDATDQQVDAALDLGLTQHGGEAGGPK